MIFNSLQYALFISLIVILYFILPQRTRWIFLLAASYFFYVCFDARYALLLLFSTVITFFSALLLHTARNQRQKVLYFVSCLVVNLGILFVFKYFNFFSETAADIMRLLGVQYQPLKLSLVLPVGISFYTFQTLGYLIDVYKGKSEPERHFGKYALFVSFFPQIAAGPIGRFESLRPQLDSKHIFDAERIRSGLLLIGQGLIKKLVIADRLAVLVNSVYDAPAKHSGIHFAIATVFFSIQIYCDFSGYTDIAIGSARLLGISLMENFKRPYLGTSVAGFWKRWHISLTSWFRDYLYIPLGGNRKRHLPNILFVFLASGLWHGASLTFVIWGFLNGLYQVLGIMTRKYTDKAKFLLKISDSSILFIYFKRLTTFVLIAFSWIFFRAASFGDLKLILTRLFTWNASFFANFNTKGLGMEKPELIVSLAAVLLLAVYEIIQEKISVGAVLRRRPIAVRWAVYMAVIAVIILFGVYGDANSSQFIYFKF
ncbi:MAG TPA: MBOAT family O-acyltransferase [Clostridia bacterium]|nr:MBOAT family O-acyltransferase [Clostridia bacterium]